MFKQLGPLEISLIILLVVLLFGARKLPETAKGIGQALRIFKKEVREDDPPTPQVTTGQTPTVTAEPLPQPVQQPAQQPAQEHDHPQR